MDANAIGIFLLHLRKEKSLTQKDIAKLCNVSTQAVSKWERGESVPDIELLDRLSMLYSLTINEIISGERKETFVDVDKRANIISLTISIIVFISYLFQFAEIREYNQSGYSWRSYYLKGYELIFDSISGWQVYLSWFVFVMLVSLLVLNIFIVSRIILKKGGVLYYIYASSIILIIVSLFGIAHELFYVFPQFIILISSTLMLWLTIYSGESSVFLYKLKKYNKLRKESKIPSELMLSENSRNSRLYKLVKILIIGMAMLFMLSFLVLLMNYITEMINQYNNPEINFMIVIAFIFLFLSILVLWTYRYLGSIYTNRLLRLDAVLALALLFTGVIFGRFGVMLFIILGISVGIIATLLKGSKELK